MKKWTSSITAIRPDGLCTHGVDQRRIIRSFSYEQMVFFLLLGRIPTAAEGNLLRAVIVSHISHGITGQSTLAVRMAADCRSGFLHALIGSLSVGAGPYHQGGLKAAMEVLQQLGTLSDREVGHEVDRRLLNGERIMGFGHRFYKNGDPRAIELMRLAARSGVRGRHVRVAMLVERKLREVRNIRMNIEAAGGAILLDLGFSPVIAHLFIVLGRGPMLAAAFLERLAEGTPPFPRLEVFDSIRGGRHG
jgi:citryl-CoA lyase